MLSREDSRRLAQMERQLWHEDPEFCIRMEVGQPEPAPRKRPPLTMILAATVAWIAALILAVMGWWAASIAAALCATAPVAALAYRMTSARHSAPREPKAPRLHEASTAPELETPVKPETIEPKPEDGHPGQSGGAARA
ncbi:DUF3040 domain-containing protein [Micromonosporaceae bacterium Da 78-11]